MSLVIIMFTELGLIQELKGSVLERYIDYEAYGRDVRLEEGGIYTHNGYYVYMIDSPKVQSEEVWGAIQEMKRIA